MADGRRLHTGRRNRNPRPRVSAMEIATEEGCSGAEVRFTRAAGSLAVADDTQRDAAVLARLHGDIHLRDNYHRRVPTELDSAHRTSRTTRFSSTPNMLRRPSSASTSRPSPLHPGF